MSYCEKCGSNNLIQPIGWTWNFWKCNDCENIGIPTEKRKLE